MGACGCCDFNGCARFEGPDGKWYVVGIYGGCRDCHAPAGVSFDLMDADELEHWDAAQLPIIGGRHEPNFGVPVFDPKKLEDDIAAELENAVSEFDQIDAGTVADEMRIADLLRSAVGKTERQYEQDLAKYRKRRAEAAKGAADE